jgi:hypothetical protein
MEIVISVEQKPKWEKWPSRQTHQERVNGRRGKPTSYSEKPLRQTHQRV